MTTRTAFTILEEAFAPIAGRHILDIGCGPGPLARALLKAGAQVTGIDPSPDAVAAARAAIPEAAFQVADGAALPFPAGTFDGAVFLNSLHHVPAASMGEALREAARVTGPDRMIAIIEPLAEGSFFELVRAVEDETEVRRQAASAIPASVAGGAFAIMADETYERRERLQSLDALLERLVAVDETRASVIAERRPQIAAAFARLAERDAAGSFLFHQPMRAVTLRVSG